MPTAIYCIRSTSNDITSKHQNCPFFKKVLAVTHVCCPSPPSRCVLGNTTILAEFAGEEEVNRFFAQGQLLGGTTSWQASPGSNQTRMGGSGAPHPIGHSPHWNNNNGSSSSLGGGAKSGGELLWGGVQQYSSLWGPPSGEEGRVMGSPTQINTLLPGDLLSGESM